MTAGEMKNERHRYGIQISGQLGELLLSLFSLLLRLYDGEFRISAQVMLLSTRLQGDTDYDPMCKGFFFFKNL